MANVSIIPVSNTRSSVKHRDDNNYVYAQGQYWLKEYKDGKRALVLTSTKTGEVKVVTIG